MAVPSLSAPQKTFWQRSKSYAWLAFKIWLCWYLAKLALVAIWAASPKGADIQNVITVAAIGIAAAASFASYTWQYVPRRTGQHARGVEFSDGAITIRLGLLWKWVVLTVMAVSVAALVGWHVTSGRSLSDKEIGVPPFDQLPSEGNCK